MEILKSQIPFGSKLINRTLQKRFGVSSSTIRDAINRLNHDGLITSIDRTGATVIDFDYNFFLEVNEVLLYVINSGVKLSYEKADIEEVCEHLEKYLLLQEKHMGTDEFFDYDYNFHKTFIIYSQNSRLKKIFKEYNVLHEMLVRSFYGPTTFQTQGNSIKMHRKIANAFRNKDYKLAMELTEQHYRYAEEIFNKIFAQRKKGTEIDSKVDEKNTLSN